jgi:hypothetical protein
MKPPFFGDVPVPVLGTDEVRPLLAACDGRGFEERRDTAIVRLFLDSGMGLAGFLPAQLDTRRVAALSGAGAGRAEAVCCGLGVERL